jgi:hypothetical protein
MSDTICDCFSAAELTSYRPWSSNNFLVGFRQWITEADNMRWRMVSFRYLQGLESQLYWKQWLLKPTQLFSRLEEYCGLISDSGRLHFMKPPEENCYGQSVQVKLSNSSARCQIPVEHCASPTMARSQAYCTSTSCHITSSTRVGLMFCGL